MHGQVKKCADAGADIVRITVQGKTEAQACAAIRKRLFEDGYAAACMPEWEDKWIIPICLA